ncbi:beta-glucuronidase [Pedobacter suwonensis]|uniref:Beta-glucuronidase n=1 Tax=Pedobacter suwonensis TaxID=332999 RepID=A0A1I0SN92_9SPHI|nr:glycoside hydrolase family 2 TIM barrel-domain containing protein [Pedobacter suwonensis]SFA40991.1 beta-glucuronidase [Pedobacter suwonensis]
MSEKKEITLLYKWIGMILSMLLVADITYAQTAMINVASRKAISLNGEWNVILDPTGIGEWRQIWLENKAKSKTDFVEYSFEGSPTLKVPGDFNSQMPELTYFEGVVWYKKEFSCTPVKNKRLFIHFGAVNYLATVYLNGKKIGSHEGGFTPFQFEITEGVRSGINALVVKVDNKRLQNGLPGLGYDWLNYGGITRDVNLIQTATTYIEDYSIQLIKGSRKEVKGWIKLNGVNREQTVKIQIPELGLAYSAKSDRMGLAKLHFTGAFKLWSLENPKRYRVSVESETDSINDEIGFRNVEVAGSRVLLNGKVVFLKGINIHEENPYKGARAFSKEDAILLLNQAKALCCNMVRLVHYPHNEHIINEAEKMGLMVWSELPVYQHIEFSDTAVVSKMDLMLKEMIRRDRNRCTVVIWSLSNETYDGTPNRTKALATLTQVCRQLDSTRLITHVTNSQSYNNNSFKVVDSLYKYADIISINEYIGWYMPWQGKPENVSWKMAFPGKPVFISEFGGEALFGNVSGAADEAASWREEYQQQIYINQLKMFNNIPNLCGVAPWLLFDYRSLGRMHPVYQKGYNRKGLLSEKGEKKLAWYTMEQYYKRK